MLSSFFSPLAVITALSLPYGAASAASEVHRTLRRNGYVSLSEPANTLTVYVPNGTCTLALKGNQWDLYAELSQVDELRHSVTVSGAGAHFEVIDGLLGIRVEAPICQASSFGGLISFSVNDGRTLDAVIETLFPSEFAPKSEIVLQVGTSAFD